MRKYNDVCQLGNAQQRTSKTYQATVAGMFSFRHIYNYTDHGKDSA